MLMNKKDPFINNERILADSAHVHVPASKGSLQVIILTGAHASLGGCVQGVWLGSCPGSVQL